MIDLVVKIEHTLPSGTNLESPHIYEQIKLKVKASLFEYYRRFSNAVVDIIINSIRLGSIDVNHTVVIENTQQAASQVTGAILKLAQGSSIVYDGNATTVSAEAYRGLGPCDVYEATVGTCGENYQCVFEDNLPTCRLAVEKENWAAILGATAGGIAFVLVIVIGIVLCVRYWMRRNSRKLDLYRERDFRKHSRKGQPNRTVQRWKDAYYMPDEAETRFPSTGSSVKPRMNITNYASGEYHFTGSRSAFSSSE